MTDSPATPASQATPPLNLTKLKALIASRKFWAALIGLVFIVIKAYYPNLPVTEDQVTNVIYLLMAYILGTAIDSSTAAKAA